MSASNEGKTNHETTQNTTAVFTCDQATETQPRGTCTAATASPTMAARSIGNEEPRRRCVFRGLEEEIIDDDGKVFQKLLNNSERAKLENAQAQFDMGTTPWNSEHDDNRDKEEHSPLWLHEEKESSNVEPLRGTTKSDSGSPTRDDTLPSQEEIPNENEGNSQLSAAHENDGQQEHVSHTDTVVPRKSQQVHQPHDGASPGAYHIRPGTNTAGTTHSPQVQEQQQLQQQDTTEHDHDQQQQRAEEGYHLVEAHLVPETSPDSMNSAPVPTTTLLVEAQPLRRRTWFSALLVLVVGAFAIALGIILSNNNNNKTKATPTTMAPSSNIIMAPTPTPPPTAKPTALPNMTAVFQDFRSRLPNETKIALTTIYSSQYKAYEWVTSDDQPPLFGIDPVTRMTQRFALVTLYYSTGGNMMWEDTTGWMNQSVHECDWFGCTCTTEGLLQSLQLRMNNLAYSLPMEIGLLSTLELLVLDQNIELKGSIPSTIGFLTNLATLDLSFSALTGQIPTEVGLLTNLKELFLGVNALEGPIPTEIGFLTNLVDFLDLPDNSLTGTIPTELGMLSSLSWLALATNDLNGTIPTELGQLDNLAVLGLHDNHLTGHISTEVLLTSLTYLGLRNNSLTSTIPSEIGLLTKLEKVLLSENLLTGSIPTSLGKLSKLGNMTLYYNRLNGSVPLELCEHIQSGMYIEIDCTLVECNCGCTCYENRTNSKLL